MMKKTSYFFVLIFSLLMFSCNSENDAVISNQKDIDTNFVSVKDAISFATLLEYDVSIPGSNTRSTKSMEVKDIKPIGNTDKPAYYIVNYKDNAGFAIVSADKRTDALLAYSTENGFDYNVQELPQGLVDWMENTNQYIQDVRESKIDTKSQTPQTRLCEALKTTTRAMSNCNDNSCPIGYERRNYVAPLLKTDWSQQNGFNNLLPLFSDIPLISCNKQGHVYSGCVAIAMAQIMYYHQYPKIYNWNNMNINYGTNEAARLIRDINIAVSMSYDCDGSGTDTKKAAKAFTSNFKYKNAIFGSFNSVILTRELKANRPVILRGKTASKLSFLGINGSGHAWVCDGYSETVSCFYTTLSLHMNWGWGSKSDNKSYNGWFGVGNWNSGNGNYDRDNAMVYNITPN